MAVLKPCAICGNLMLARPSLVARKRYCSKRCARRGWSGQRRSPDTEFKKGCRPQTWVPVGSESVATNGGYIKVKVAEPNVWRLRSHLVWEKTHGRPLPEGWIIRRRDGDPRNDAPENLVAMPRSQHLLKTLEDPEILARSRRRVSRAALARWQEYRESQESQYDGYYWEAA